MTEALAVVSLVLALPPVVEEVIRVGKDLARRIELCKGSPESLDGLAIFREEALKTKMRFGLGYRICNSLDPSIDEEIRAHLDQKFQDIQRTINEANLLVTKLEKGGLRNFWKLDELRREIEKRIRSLEASITSFNDTINLVHIEQAGSPSAKLASEVFQHSNDVQTAISETSVLVRCHLDRDTNKVSAKRGTFLLEVRPYKETTKPYLESSLAYLTQTLIYARMSASILRATGYADDPENQRFLLVFDIPEALVSVGTLQSLLQSKPHLPALNVRVALCSKLADAIFEVHNLRLVHKNVNSASILIMTPQGITLSDVTDREIRAYLLNWHLVRKFDAASISTPELNWWKGIYQHPGRQIALTEDEYTMGHDIYSLGVCMLEALLWKPLVQFVEGAKPTVNPIFAEHAMALGVINHAPESLQSFLDKPQETKDIQRVLLSIANQHLPAVAGQKLTSLVTSCLNCLEDGFGHLSFQLGTGRVELGMNYVTAVKASFSEICI